MSADALAELKGALQRGPLWNRQEAFNVAVALGYCETRGIEVPNKEPFRSQLCLDPPFSPSLLPEDALGAVQYARALVATNVKLYEECHLDDTLAWKMACDRMDVFCAFEVLVLSFQHYWVLYEDARANRKKPPVPWEKVEQLEGGLLELEEAVHQWDALLQEAKVFDKVPLSLLSEWRQSLHSEAKVPWWLDGIPVNQR